MERLPAAASFKHVARGAKVRNAALELRDPEPGVARVLAFATGSDRIPVDGFRPPLTLTHDAARTDALPVAHTCFNQIILSRASSYAAAARQLRCAVDNCASFELS